MDELTTIDFMKKAEKTFEERSKVYGHAGFQEQGKVLEALFPSGIHIEGSEDFSRWVIFNHILTKICRYAKNMHTGGHNDSIHDLGVYSFILEAFDANLRSKGVDDL